jgi:hypothetical protein
LYLRHAVRRKDGKAHTYWRLVRSVRRGGKVVQETVAVKSIVVESSGGIQMRSGLS